jgi:hypothetical protein
LPKETLQYLYFIKGGSIEEETYRPHSRITRDWPIKTAMMFPKADIAMRMFSPFTLDPKTSSKNREATVCFPAASAAFGTAARYATLARIYNIATRSKANVALFLMV